MNRKMPDILHLPDVIGGHPTALARGERALGARSRTLCIQPSPYDYQADRTLAHWNGSFFEKWSERVGVFKEVRQRHDIYHFNFGASLLQAPRMGLILPEIGFYDGRKIMTFQGDDARIDYPRVLKRSIDKEVELGHYCVARAKRAYVDSLRLKKRRITIARTVRHCDHIIALNPDLMSHLPDDKTSFLPYAVELPEQIPEQINVGARDRKAGSPLALVHLSTARAIKGTGLIEEAVARAGAFCDVTLDVVVQQPRKEALARLAAADYLIDQMVLGWFGATAVEAMYLGVPVICHLDEEALQRVPEMASELPIIKADIDTLVETIIDLAKNRERRPGLVTRCRAYADKWHRPEQVAKRTLALYSALN